MLEILQDKDSSKVVLIKLGHFYIATGRDAVLLYKKLNLKCTCFKNNICKVGIPVNSLEKYVEKFNQMQYSYIIYDYDKQANEIKEIINKTGKACKIKDKNINCLKCKGISEYKDDEYIVAFSKFFEKKNEDYIEYMLNVILKLSRTEKKKPCKLKNNKNIGLKQICHKNIENKILKREHKNDIV